MAVLQRFLPTFADEPRHSTALLCLLTNFAATFPRPSPFRSSAGFYTRSSLCEGNAASYNLNRCNTPWTRHLRHFDLKKFQLNTEQILQFQKQIA